MLIRRSPFAIGAAAALAVVGPTSGAFAAAAPTPPTVSVAASADLVREGSVFKLGVSYRCRAGLDAAVAVQGVQNVGAGFVAHGFGFSDLPLGCDGATHRLTLTVVPDGERGFKRGHAYVIGGIQACTSDLACESDSVERVVAIR